MNPLRRPTDDREVLEAPSRPRRLERTTPPPETPEKRPNRRRVVIWSVVAAVVLVVGLLADRYGEGIARRILEGRLNRHLEGYTVTLAAVDLRPLKLGMALQGTVVRQEAHPEPPVIVLPELEVGVEWKELLRFHLVADAVFERPRVHVNLPQLREEDRDEVDIEDRGWQDAFQSLYPLKFNRVEVRDGEVVYLDRDPERPLELTDWNLLAENIRNVAAAKGSYPSPVHSEAVLFGTGRGVVEGHADFLSKPYPGVHVHYRVERVPVERLGIIASRANLSVEGGELQSSGRVEYSPLHREARVEDLTIHGLRVDYLHTAATAEAEKERASQAVQAAQDPQPDLLVRMDRMHFTDAVLGWVDRAAPTPYRVFVDQTDVVVTGYSSGFKDKPAKAKVRGRFMGSGTTRADATFRQYDRGPSFDLDVAVESASLPAMNDLLRAYGKLDVVDGSFSVYSEVKVDGGKIEGYVKPLVKDVEVYSSKQDETKPVLKRLYEKIAGGISHLLENQPRDEVATVVDLSGTVEDPDTNLWQVAGRLVKNAFIEAILPGFDREFEAAKKKRG